MRPPEPITRNTATSTTSSRRMIHFKRRLLRTPRHQLTNIKVGNDEIFQRAIYWDLDQMLRRNEDDNDVVTTVEMFERMKMKNLEDGTCFA